MSETEDTATEAASEEQAPAATTPASTASADLANAQPSTPEGKSSLTAWKAASDYVRYSTGLYEMAQERLAQVMQEASNQRDTLERAKDALAKAQAAYEAAEAKGD